MRVAGRAAADAKNNWKNAVWRDDVGSMFTVSLRTFDISTVSDMKTTLSGLSELRVEGELTLAISIKTRQVGLGTIYVSSASLSAASRRA